MKNRIEQWLLPRYKRYKQKRHSTDPEHIEVSIRALLDKSRYAFLISQTGENDHSSTRYVQPVVEWHGHSFLIWIGTQTTSRKIAEIRQNPRVTLAVGLQGDGANLIIYGEASLHTDDDKRRKYWKSYWSLFFPDGPLSDDAILICVKPLKLELMDFKRNVIPEPFGLKPLCLVQREQQWVAGS